VDENPPFFREVPSIFGSESNVDFGGCSDRELDFDFTITTGSFGYDETS
jgi:hypothetical protein